MWSASEGGYEITTDAYIRGVDEACVILDMIARTILPSGRHAVTLDLNGSPQQNRALLSEIKSSGMWRASWRIELGTISRKMILRARSFGDRRGAEPLPQPRGVARPYRPISWPHACASTSMSWRPPSSGSLIRVSRHQPAVGSTSPPCSTLRPNLAVMTVRELYQWAAREKVLDAQIRICDGMAVSYYRA